MITPIEIRKQTFRKSLRGYDTEEVQAFLQTLSDEWEQQQHEMRQMKTHIDQLQADYNSLKKVENMLHKTLLQAEQSAKQTLDNALQKAELKIQAAEAQGKEIIRRAQDSTGQLERDIDKLESRKEEVVLHLEIFLKSQLDRLRAFERRELPAIGATTPEIPQEIAPEISDVVSNQSEQVEQSIKSSTAEKGLFPTNGEEQAGDDFSDEL